MWAAGASRWATTLSTVQPWQGVTSQTAVKLHVAYQVHVHVQDTYRAHALPVPLPHAQPMQRPAAPFEGSTTYHVRV